MSDTPTAIDQSHMVVENSAESVGTMEENARQGGRIATKGFEENETRPQEMHGSVNYQKETADPGQTPKFNSYTELTATKGTVRG